MTGFATGPRVAAVLRASGLTRDDFAAELDVSGPFISMLTSGRRELSLELARRIQGRYGYRVGWLLEGELPEKVGKRPSPAARRGPLSLLQEAMALLRVAEANLAAPDPVAPDEDEAGRAVQAMRTIEGLKAGKGRQPGTRRGNG